MSEQQWCTSASGIVYNQNVWGVWMINQNLPPYNGTGAAANPQGNTSISDGARLDIKSLNLHLSFCASGAPDLKVWGATKRIKDVRIESGKGNHGSQHTLSFKVAKSVLKDYATVFATYQENRFSSNEMTLRLSTPVSFTETGDAEFPLEVKFTLALIMVSATLGDYPLRTMVHVALAEEGDETCCCDEEGEEGEEGEDDAKWKRVYSSDGDKRPWQIFAFGPDAEEFFESDGESARVIVFKNGDGHIFNDEIKFVSGETYRMTFFARNRQNSGNSFLTVGVGVGVRTASPVEITGDWKDEPYTVFFTVPDGTQSKLQIMRNRVSDGGAEVKKIILERAV